MTTQYSGSKATASAGDGPATITIALPATQGDTESSTAAKASTTYNYKIYKVFDAVPASTTGSTTTVAYSVISTKRDASKATNAEKAGFDASNGMASYFEVDDAYNVSALSAAKDENNSNELTPGAVAAIRKYINGTTEVADVSVNSKNDTNDVTTVEISGLKYGYYYITTTTGSVVTVDTTSPTATVNDKNTVPTLDKSISAVSSGSKDTNGDNAIAEIGSEVTFTSVITVGKGAIRYVYHDKMGSGLSFEGITSIATDNSSKTVFTEITDYTVVKATDENNFITDGDTFEINFQDAAVQTLTAGNKITIIYKAKVVDPALRDHGYDTVPVNANNANGTNTAHVEYNGHSTPEDSVKVYNAKITVTKTFGGLSDDSALNNDSAEFVLSKANTEETGKVYYNYNESSKTVSWVNEASSATKLSFNKSNETHEFTGLADGTYTLTEYKVPAGYNKAADQTITINGSTVEKAFENSNLEQSKTIENKQGSVLPSTGGIGTTIFYIAGIALVIGAAVLLVNRKHKENA